MGVYSTDLKCIVCKRKVGEVELGVAIVSEDPYCSVEIYCHECAEKQRIHVRGEVLSEESTGESR